MKIESLKKKIEQYEKELEELYFEEESAANPLLKLSGIWQGDDLDECLNDVYRNRI